MNLRLSKFEGVVSDSGSIVVLMTMCVALMLSMFNASMIGVLLPGIVEDITASSTDMQWIATIYMLGLAASLMPGSSLGRRYGRRWALLVGLSIFLIGALLCATAQELWWLLLGRLIQAVGVGIYLPQTLAILVIEYSDLRRRARAIGVWSGVASIGLIIGPLVGGTAVMLVNWRAGFLLSVMLCLCALLAAWRGLSEERHGCPEEAYPLDGVGTLLSVFWLSCLVFGLNESSRQGWGSEIVVQALISAAVGLFVFLIVESWRDRRGCSVLMPLGIWNNRRFIAANIGGATFFMSLFGVLFFYSIYFYVEFGYHSVAVGAAFIPMTLMMALSASVGGRLIARWGIFKVLIVGAVCAALAMFVLSIVTSQKSHLLVEVSLALTGVGFGFLSVSTSNGAVSSVSPPLSGLASGVHTTCRQIGSALGISLLGVFVHSGRELGSAGKFAEGLASAMQFSAGVVFCTALATWLLLRRR
ncbi:MFS transporter [Pseudomonas syringae]|uniref:MFS transporter n=1 Tax=Pseudomonas syringae TaxID=317 RepID=UPI001F425842|nr:MFS transporter [Pseudomonas syringae]MCF5724664.1 MFS transporter [Pseudomonas syringae]